MAQKPTILIVDDQLSNLAFLDMLLTEEGYDTQVVRSGEDALKVAQSMPIDLILLDVTMPGWDGYETCTHIKADPSLVKIPVLFLSALGDADARVKGFDVGGVDYIHKPFQKAELLARVKNHVDLYRLREHLEHEVQVLDSQLVDYANTLERKVEARTAELIAAKEEAEAGNRAKSQFLATMSHELRTPMNAIIGYSEMLAEDEADPDKQEDLQKIHGAAKHLLGLINDVLDLSKIESGKMDLYLEDFAVRDMLEEITSTAAPLVGKRNNHFNVDIDDNVGNVYADLTKCRQIMLNFLSNAAKFTENGEVSLRVKREENAGQEWLALTVSDQGIGLTEEQQKKLFRPFSQADASTTRRYGGTGLGLAISKQFVDMMGGTISVRSVFGAGATFTVYLPVRVTKPIKVLRKEDVLPQLAGIVLVVHEDSSTSGMIKNYLSHLGYSVALAPNGKEALQLANKLRPDAILASLALSDMDGWALIAKLKANPMLTATPVFIATDNPDAVIGEFSEATDYLNKSPTEAQLAAMLKKHGLDDKNSTLIMVVDDDPIQRELVEETLDSQGWKAFSVENGRVALEQMSIRQPSMIMLDLQMPEMDGFEFAERLRENDRWKHIPVVVMTSMSLGAEEYARLHKHVQGIHSKQTTNPAELLPQIHELLSAAMTKGNATRSVE